MTSIASIDDRQHSEHQQLHGRGRPALAVGGHAVLGEKEECETPEWARDEYEGLSLPESERRFLETGNRTGRLVHSEG